MARWRRLMLVGLIALGSMALVWPPSASVLARQPHQIRQLAAGRAKKSPAQEAARQLVDAPPTDPLLGGGAPKTGCDLLFSASDKLANYCQCNEPAQTYALDGFERGQPQDERAHQLEGQLGGSSSGDELGAAINQLTCVHHNFSQIIQDFYLIATNTTNTNRRQSVAIGYLNVMANMSSHDGGASTIADDQLAHGGQLAPIDHMTLQLSWPLDNGQLGGGGGGEREPLGGETIRPTDKVSAQMMIESQMIDFVRLTNETHLQSLSIFLSTVVGAAHWRQQRPTTDYAGQQQQQQLDNNDNNNNILSDADGGGQKLKGSKSSGRQIRLTKLLAKLGGLNRLELSFIQKVGSSSLSLLLESSTFQHQTKMKWLNLASLASIEFGDGGKMSPFVPCTNLEHLSLEANNLKAFPLLSLFTNPFESHHHEHSLQFGQFNLSSLNLAHNKLASLDYDLFNYFHYYNGAITKPVLWCNKRIHNRIFLLPALIQLDLSHNQLKDITFEAAQNILCTMPNLSQLYLQHNKIIHLNMNSLLNYPITIMPQSINDSANQSHLGTTIRLASNDTKFSRLEFVDLSHNRLRKITSIQPSDSNSSHQVRLKYINLSYNELKRPLDVINKQLINKIIFKETFDLMGKGQSVKQLNLDYLEWFFDINIITNPTTLCDLLSPAMSNAKLSTNRHDGDDDDDDDDDDLLSELILNNNNLNIISSKDFSSQQCRHIQIVRLANNRIVNIENEALVALHHLEQLDLSENLLCSLPENLFIKTTKLKLLNLSKNKINLLDKNIFSSLLELEELLLNQNELTHISSNLFAHNQQLTIIDLSNNKLVDLDVSSLYNLEQLKILNLQGNLLKQFDHHIFKARTNTYFSSSKHQRTDDLQLSKQKTSARKSIDSPNYINHNDTIKRPTSKKPKKNDFKTRQRRQRRQIDHPGNMLILASNQIDRFEFDRDKCDQFIRNVQVLWLNGNQLKGLSETSFRCFSSLQSLRLDSNLIKTIDSLTFSPLIKLEHLGLANNQLSRLRAGTFAPLKYLRQVDLSNNKLLDISLDSLFVDANRINPDETIQLENLDLSENPRLELDTNDLITLMTGSMLKILNFGSIRTVSGPTQHRPTAPIKIKLELESLNMSSIAHLDDAIFTTLIDHAISIDDCDLSYMNQVMVKSEKFTKFLLMQLSGTTKWLNLAGNKLTNEQLSIIFNDVTNQTRITNLNWQSNLLDRWPFDQKMAKKLQNLKELNLSENKLRYFIHNETKNYEFGQLETLNLSSNSILALMDHSNHPVKRLNMLMPRLKEIDISQNRLTWIPFGFFDELDWLISLKLDHNQLETMPAISSSNSALVNLRFNTKLRSIVVDHNKNIQETYSFNFVNDDDLVIFSDRTGGSNALSCHLIDNYLHRLHESPNEHASEYRFGFNQLVVSQNDVQDDHHQVEHQPCDLFLRSVDSINLDHASQQINLNLIRISNNNPIKLSMQMSNLIQVETSIKNWNIVQLDLSNNKIQALPISFCQDLIELRSLELDRNQIQELPPTLFQCAKLRYLDLSHNKIDSLANTTPDSVSSSLLVLKLDHNQIKDLNNINLNLFPYLRHVDLRNNLLKTYPMMPIFSHSSLNLLLTDHGATNSEQIIDKRWAIRINESLLTVESKKTKLLMDIQQNMPYGSPVQYGESLMHSIKYCTLDSRNITQLCFRTVHEEVNKCLFLKTPKVPVCLTTLDGNNDTPLSLHQNSSAYSLITSTHTKDQKAISKSKSDEDPVLNFIDFIKINWLKFKSFDLNDYLISMTNIKNDSVWMEINGKHTIYTLTILKLAIVVGSICIVILLIAMFAMLVYISGNRNVMSPTITSEMADLTNDSSTSSITTKSSSSSKNLSHPSGGTSTQLTDGSCSYGNKSSDSSNNETVIERNKRTIQQLDTGNLLNQQQCSTPSSSLAPSSIETGETMQAIDSIQSAPSEANLGGGGGGGGGSLIKISTDQRCDNSNINYSTCQRHQPVATVMRMVNSRSFNFDTNRQQNITLNTSYGTLNSRVSNYPNLRSRICPIHEEQREQSSQLQTFEHQNKSNMGSLHYDQGQQHCLFQYNNNYEVAQPTYNMTTNTANDDTNSWVSPLPTLDSPMNQDLDPTTLSLLSINTALSGGQGVWRAP